MQDKAAYAAASNHDLFAIAATMFSTARKKGNSRL